jgi:isoquinoline 1-oxidoreductase beta subunit
VGWDTFANTFAIETFMDEIAHALQVDPLEFRLRYLPEGEIGERIKTALETVRQASNWGQSMPSGMGRGLAIAYDRKTVVALVMTVQVEGEKIRARQAWCAS